MRETIFAILVRSDEIEWQKHIFCFVCDDATQHSDDTWNMDGSFCLLCAHNEPNI